MCAYADDGEELTENIKLILDSLDLTELQNYLDSYGGEYLSSLGGSAREIVEALIGGDLKSDYGEYLSQIFKLLFSDVSEMVPYFSQVAAITVLCAIASDVEGNVIGKTTAGVIRLCCTAAVMFILSTVLLGVVEAVSACIKNIKRQIEIITPILVTLTVLSGGSESGAIYKPCAVFLSGGAVEVVSSFIMPATLVTVTLNFMSRLNPQISFMGVAALIKSCMKWAIGLTVAVFGIFITVQSSASSLFNGIFFKVTKYLVGSSVPIVGNFLSAGVDMVVLSGTAVKSSLGLTGVVLLLSEIIKPIVMLAAFNILLKVCGAVAQPIGEKNLYSLYSNLSKDSEYYVAGVLMVAFMYFLVVMLVINSTYAFI